MKSIITTRSIQAPLDQVFETISDVRNFREAVPHIIEIEFLTDQQTGVGTRFRETRVMNGHEQTVVLEVAEYVSNERVRMISTRVARSGTHCSRSANPETTRWN